PPDASQRRMNGSSISRLAQRHRPGPASPHVSCQRNSQLSTGIPTYPKPFLPGIPSYPQPFLPGIPSYPQPFVPGIPGYPQPFVPGIPSYPQPFLPGIPSYPQLLSHNYPGIFPHSQSHLTLLGPSQQGFPADPFAQIQDRGSHVGDFGPKAETLHGKIPGSAPKQEGIVGIHPKMAPHGITAFPAIFWRIFP
uniref:Uncharacterized protein n=1 Tax=Cyanistes caeruleus TaxID=156563 RepID=A0A8C0U4Q1_CYACU